MLTSRGRTATNSLLDLTRHAGDYHFKKIMKDDRQLINWVQWGIEGYGDRTCIFWTRKGSDLYRRPTLQALVWPSQKHTGGSVTKTYYFFRIKYPHLYIYTVLNYIVVCELFLFDASLHFICILTKNSVTQLIYIYPPSSSLV